MSKIKKSLLFQTSFLFFISTLIILSLWGIFYLQELKEIKGHKINRYMRTVEFLQPLLFTLEPITKEHLDAFAMQEFTQEIEKAPFFQRGNENIGVKVYEIEGETILQIYNPINQITLKDIGRQKSTSSIHTIFSLLLFLQLLLYLRLKTSLSPLAKLHSKFQSLHSGDLSPLDISSKYEEIQQIQCSYNKAVKKLDYLLNMREMFNKIFMHELKTPLAKGMFYLKLPPSQQTNEKLTKLFVKINDEIDDFAKIESLIAQRGSNNDEKTPIKTVLSQSLQKLDAVSNEHIVIEQSDESSISGDRDLWVLCFKNIIDNALKYSLDKKLIISYANGAISFKNKAHPLPVDITKDVAHWELKSSQRHKSSTGYGFGLFIITSIVKIQNYTLQYQYADDAIILKIVVKTL